MCDCDREPEYEDAGAEEGYHVVAVAPLLDVPPHVRWQRILAALDALGQDYTLTGDPPRFTVTEDARQLARLTAHRIRAELVHLAPDPADTDADPFA